MNINHRVFYLKYRPQKFSELVGLEDVKKIIIGSLKREQIPHALLFSGPKGTGKTSTARIFAKAVNCRKPHQGEPCNKCDICQEITNGTALDLIEIDAASNRGIDDIRDLREKVRLAPAQLKTKVYIIDEAHMLTTEAFNALLKTLEEPPENTFFILCTTAPEKLPATIISRCIRFNFKKATAEELVKSLVRVVKGEKLKVEKGVLEEITAGADGSFRDAQKVLDQLSAGEKQISLKKTKQLLGNIETFSPKNLLNFLAQKQPKEAILEIDRLVNAGVDLMNYTQDLLERLRLGLLTEIGLEGIEKPEELAGLGKNNFQFLLEIFSKAANQIKTNPIPQLPLELAVVEWCEESEKREFAHRNFGSSSDSLTKETPPETKADTHSQGEASQNLMGSSRPNGKGGLEEIEKRWEELLTNIKPLNHSVEALLKACRPIELRGDYLTLEVFYRFHKERLEDEKCRAIFEETASQLLGHPIKLKCVLGEKKIPANLTRSDFFESKIEEAQKKADENLANAADGDLMKMAEEIFGKNAN